MLIQRRSLYILVLPPKGSNVLYKFNGVQEHVLIGKSYFGDKGGGIIVKTGKGIVKRANTVIFQIYSNMFGWPIRTSII